CPACGGALEMELDVKDVRIAAPPALTDELPVAVAGCEIRARLPNSIDLAAIAAERDLTTARRTLLRRCILEIRRDGEACALDHARHHSTSPSHRLRRSNPTSRPRRTWRSSRKWMPSVRRRARDAA